MRSVIIPVFSQSDLDALPNCLRYLAQQPVENILVLHGPNVGVVNADVTKEFDQKIAALDTRKRELTIVEDFLGAGKAKEEIETLKVERDMAIRDGWKKLPDDQRAAAYKRAFGKFEESGIAVWPLREAYQHDQVFAMLQALLPQFPSDISHGQFALVWPRSVSIVPKVQGTVIATGTLAESKNTANTRETREAEVKAMHHAAVLQLAKRSGIAIKGKKVADVITELLDKEFPRELVAA